MPNPSVLDPASPIRRFSLAALVVAAIGIGGFALLVLLDRWTDVAQVAAGRVISIERHDLGDRPNVHLGIVLDDGRHVVVSSHEALSYKQGDRILVTEHHDALGRTLFTVRQ